MCTLQRIEHDEALECYNKALEIDPDYISAWNNKGYPLYGLDRYEAAIECYDTALEIDPGFGLAINNRAKAESALNPQQPPTAAPTTTQQAPLSAACAGFAIPLTGLVYRAGKKIRER